MQLIKFDYHIPLLGLVDIETNQYLCPSTFLIVVWFLSALTSFQEWSEKKHMVRAHGQTM